MCVECECGERVVCTVMSEVSGEITTTLKVVVIVDEPASHEVGDMVKVLDVGDKGSKYESIVDWLR